MGGRAEEVLLPSRLTISTGEAAAGRERPSSWGSLPTLPGLVTAKGRFMFTPRPWSWVRDAHPHTHPLGLGSEPQQDGLSKLLGKLPTKAQGWRPGWGLPRKR